MSGTRASAPRIVTIVNRRARKLAGEGTGSTALLDVLREPRPGVRVLETRSIGELSAVAEEIARDVPDAVILAGGDGSYMAGVSALERAFAAFGLRPSSLPSIALAPGGTVSTVARNWGFKGGGLFTGGAAEVKYATRLLDALTSRRARGMDRPTLRVVDDRSTRIGFIVGAGLVSRFFEVYAEEGARGYRGAANIVARIFLGSFTSGGLAERVLTPVPCTMEVDGVRMPLERTSLVCASVVKDLGLGMRLLHRAGEERDRFHVVASTLGPSRLGPQLPLVLLGRPLVGAGRIDALAQSLTLRFPESDGAYVLDGELMRAERVDVTAGPILRILTV